MPNLEARLANRAVDATSHSVHRVYPIDPMPGTRMDLVAGLVLGTIGLIVQLKMKATTRTKRGA